MKDYISLNIKHLISREGISNDAFGRRLELKRGAVGSYLAEKAKPKIETIQKISAIFNISIDDFINKDLSSLDNFGKKEDTNSNHDGPTGDLEKDLVAKFDNISTRDISFYTYLNINTMMEEPIFKSLIENLATTRALELLKEK